MTAFAAISEATRQASATSRSSGTASRRTDQSAMAPATSRRAAPTASGAGTNTLGRHRRNQQPVLAGRIRLRGEHVGVQRAEPIRRGRASCLESRRGVGAQQGEVERARQLVPGGLEGQGADDVAVGPQQRDHLAGGADRRPPAPSRAMTAPTLSASSAAVRHPVDEEGLERRGGVEHHEAVLGDRPGRGRSPARAKASRTARECAGLKTVTTASPPRSPSAT